MWLAVYTLPCEDANVSDQNGRKQMSSEIKRQEQGQVTTANASHGALNILESAAYCGVRCAAIESAIRDGRLSARLLGRNIIVLKRDLDTFLERLDVIPPHTPPSVLKRRRERELRRVTP